MTGYPKTFIPLHIQRSRAAFCSVKTYSLKRNKQRSFHDWLPQNLYSSAYPKIQSSLLFRKDLFFKKKQAKKFSRLAAPKSLFSAYPKIQRSHLFRPNSVLWKNKGFYYALPFSSNCFRNNVEKSFTLTKNVLILLLYSIHPDKLI